MVITPHIVAPPRRSFRESSSCIRRKTLAANSTVYRIEATAPILALVEFRRWSGLPADRRAPTTRRSPTTVSPNTRDLHGRCGETCNRYLPSFSYEWPSLSEHRPPVLARGGRRAATPGMPHARRRRCTRCEVAGGSRKAQGISTIQLLQRAAAARRSQKQNAAGGGGGEKKPRGTIIQNAVCRPDRRLRCNHNHEKRLRAALSHSRSEGPRAAHAHPICAREKQHEAHALSHLQKMSLGAPRARAKAQGCASPW